MVELRPYQQEAMSAVLNEWDSGNSKTLLVLPTGCGKTIVFAKIVLQEEKGFLFLHIEQSFLNKPLIKSINPPVFYVRPKKQRKAVSAVGIE